MGTYYYLVLPKNRVLFYLGKNVNCDMYEEISEKLSSMGDLGGDMLLDIDIKEMTLRDLLKVLKLAELGEYLQLLIDEPTLMVYYYAKYILGEDVRIISELDEEFDKYKKWKVIDIK